MIICHRPPGNPENAQTIEVPIDAAARHLRAHELDTIGPCPNRDVQVTGLGELDKVESEIELESK